MKIIDSYIIEQSISEQLNFLTIKDFQIYNKKFINEKVNIDKYKFQFKNQTKKFINKLNKEGANGNQIYKLVLKHTNSIKRISPTVKIKEISQHVDASLRGMWKEMKKIGILKSLTAGALILIVVVFLNTVCIYTLQIVFGIQMGYILASITAAPLIEEFGKFISVKYKITLGHFIPFNIFEFILHMSRLIKRGMNPIQATISRTITIFFHYFQTKLHMNARIDSEFVKDPKLKEKILKTGLTSAIIYHAIWNGVTAIPILLAL